MASAQTHSIVTLTMNPALDKSTHTQRVVPEDKLRCTEVVVEPGGGGINVSRAVKKLGGNSLLLYAAGGFTGEELGLLINAEAIPAQRIPLQGSTRESFTVLEESSTCQYRFNMPGPVLTEREWERALEMAATLSPQPDYLVASGSLPPGVPEDFYVRLAQRLAGSATRLIVDTSGPALAALVAEPAPVYLIKPNLRELQDLAGHHVDDDEEIVDAARGIIARGGIRNLVISLGAGGVIMANATQAARQRTPTVPIRSKIGAGDSTVAGIVLALARGWSEAEAVRFGVAAGAAAVMTLGSELCRRDDTERLYTRMTRNLMPELI
jgi:6-phosphofructokinase 2